MEAILDENPGYKLLGKDKLKKKLKGMGISSKAIDDWFNSKEINQIYARPKKVKSYKINGPPNSFQIDLVLLPTYQKHNHGIREFLMLIDILSRKVWAYPLKNGKMETVMIEYKKFVNSVSKKKIMSIEGDDFFSAAVFKEYNNANGINTFTDIAKDDHLTNHGNKLGIIDRAVRTIKNIIEKYLLIHDTNNWVDAIYGLINLYNDTPHSSLQDRTPNDAYDDEKYLLLKYLKNQRYNDSIQSGLHLHVGDKVRAVVGKNVFDKEKAPFSKEIYTIDREDGRRFIIVDEKGTAMKRRYRPSELLKIGEVNERIGNKKDKAVEEHKKIVKTRKALGELTNERTRAYDEAVAAIGMRDKPKEKRITKRVTKLDL